MTKLMSLNASKELLISIKQKYNDASWIDKRKKFDGIVADTGYERKYTIELLNKIDMHVAPKKGGYRITTMKRCYKLYY